MTEAPTSTRTAAVFGTLSDYLNHENVLVRFVSLWLVLVTLFMSAWYISYLHTGERIPPFTAGVNRRLRYH